MITKGDLRNKVVLTVQDNQKEWSEENLIADFTVKVTSKRDELIEERFKVFINDKPASMSNKNWEKLLKKVLRSEYYNKLIERGTAPHPGDK